MLTEKQVNIQEARKWFNNKWPEELWTEVMFFLGARITKEEFEKDL